MLRRSQPENLAGKTSVSRLVARRSRRGEHGERRRWASDRTSDQLQCSGCPRASTDCAIWVELALSSVISVISVVKCIHVRLSFVMHNAAGASFLAQCRAIEHHPMGVD